MKKIFLITCLFLTQTLSVFSQSSTKVIVYVRTTAGDLVSGVSITLTATDYSKTLTTDEQRKATVDLTAAGVYTAKISLPSSSSYMLTDTEIDSKQTTVSEGETDEIYFGVKLKPADETNNEEELKATLPSAFTKSGSTTTKVDKLSNDQLKAVTNFTLHIPNKSKIVFNKAVNLSGEDTIGRLARLDQYVFMEEVGEVGLASDLMPELDTQATITLYGLNIINLGEGYKPAILKDDLVPSSTEVKNIKLDGTNSVSFQVEGFSTYSYIPTLQLDNNELTTDVAEYEVTGRIDDLDSEIIAFLNDERINQDIPINADGTFKIALTLAEKENELQITATGSSKQMTSETLEITFNTQENITPAKTKNTNYTNLAAFALIALGLSTGIGYYLYKNKYLKRKQKSIKMPVRKDQFDSRLLTPEEKAIFDVPGDDKQQVPKM